MLDSISHCWQVTWSAQAMNATQSCFCGRGTKISHSTKNNTSNRKFTKYRTKLELSFWKDEGRNIHSAGFSLHFTCADSVILLWSEPFLGISHQHTPTARSKPQAFKTMIHCANSQTGTQFHQESNLDVKCFSRNSPSSKEIFCWL